MVDRIGGFESRYHFEQLEQKRSLMAFIAASRGYRRPLHLTPYIDALERSRTEPVRLVLSAPPRHGKSMSALSFIVQSAIHYPKLRIGYATYGIEFSQRQSKLAAMLAQERGLKLREERADFWRTEHGGQVIWTSVGGGFTGLGVDLLICDDLIKGRAEADSRLVRDATFDWFQSVAYTRLEPGASVVVMATRWSRDDPSGRLIEQGWPNINMPALSDRGEALCPWRYDVAALSDIRKQIGEFEWSALYMGDPRIRGTSLFGEPARYETPETGGKIYIGVDPAASAKTHADYSVITVISVVGAGPTSRCDILDVTRVQLEVPELCRRLEGIQARWNAELHIESVGVGKAVPQVLRSINPLLRIREVHPVGDKFSRAQQTAAAWQQGRIRVPYEAPWLKDFLQEVTSFTGINDRHDDCVDSLCIAFDASQIGANLTRAHAGGTRSYAARPGGF